MEVVDDFKENSIFQTRQDRRTHELRLGWHTQDLHGLTPLKILPRRRGLESHSYLEKCGHLFADGRESWFSPRSDTWYIDCTPGQAPHPESVNTWAGFEGDGGGGREGGENEFRWVGRRWRGK